MIPKLRFFIDQDVYWAYHPTFYKRTRWLKRRSDVIEHYISNLQHKLRGGIRIVDKIYNSVSDRNKFQHGNPKEALNPEAFLEILNGESGTFNPFGFPYIKRRSFWEDFLDWAKDNYADIFMRKCKRHKIDLKNIGSSENVILNKPKPKETSPEPPSTSISGTNMDIGRTAIPTKKTGGINFVFGVHKYSNANSSENDSFLNQLARARNGREMGIQTERAERAKDSIKGTWDNTD